ncbi:MAG: GGDEF domain-containing protein, partial [Gammaproteobacteria bacterium]|nr:GGDEF domain-containing protein [Gammaproteobacteria bacterium]
MPAAAGTTAAAQLAAQASAAAAQLLKTQVEAAQALAAQASAAAAQLVKTQVEAAEELADLGEQFQMFMDMSGIAAATVTRQGTFLVANPAMFTLMGRSKDSLLGSNWTELIHPDDIEVFLAMVDDLETDHQTSQRTLVRYLDGDGGVFWGDTSISAVVSPVGGLPFRIVQIVGGSHLTDLQSELLTRATNDFLTGLANRATALVEIELAIQSGLDNGKMTAVLQLGLDGLAKINHQRGREAGDEILQAAGGRIASAIREGDLVARVEGDTFAIIMRGLSNASEVDKRAALVIEAFHSPFLTHGLEAYVTASIGIAIAGPTLPIDAGDLLHQASEAMRQAKAQRGGRAVWFDIDLETASSEREQIEFGLRHALDRRELEVWYQPEILLATGTVSAVEALVRWRHPDGSVWTAQRFIGVAEDSGLILDIGTWVLHQACTQGAT